MAFPAGVLFKQGVTVSDAAGRSDVRAASFFRKLSTRVGILLLGASLFTACATKPPLYYWSRVTFENPKPNPPKLSAIAASACQEPSLGRVLPVYIWVTNNTSKDPRSVELSQIFALNDMDRTP